MYEDIKVWYSPMIYKGKELIFHSLNEITYSCIRKHGHFILCNVDLFCETIFMELISSANRIAPTLTLKHNGVILSVTTVLIAIDLS